jgi:uncharacterized protein
MPTNTETVKAMYAAFSHGDLETILSHLTEDVSWEAEAPTRLGFSGIARGIPGATEFFTALATHYSNSKLDMTEFFEKPNAVAVFGRYQTTVNATGKSVDTPVAHLFLFRDGKVSRYVNLINSGAILEALEP